MRFPSFYLLALIAAPWASPVQAQAGFIILARHAEKAAPDGDPGLTTVGELRARDLATALAGVRLAAVITTQYRRTRLTAAPTADAARLQPMVIPATGDIGADAAAVARTLDSLPPGSAALVVGHSNTLGPIIAALGGPALPDLCDAEFSTLLILQRDGAGSVSLLRSRYGAAESPAVSQCNATR